MATDPLATTHLPTIPISIEYPTSAKTKKEKDNYKTELLTNNIETLYADCDTRKVVTNIIYN